MDLQTLSTIAGLVSLGIVIVGAIYVVRSNVGKATSDAQQNAITALQAEVATLRNRIEDAEKENMRLQQTIQTICAALKVRGMVITIQGEMIHIQDDKGNSTTTHMQNSLRQAGVTYDHP